MPRRVPRTAAVGVALIAATACTADQPSGGRFDEPATSTASTALPSVTVSSSGASASPGASPSASTATISPRPPSPPRPAVAAEAARVRTCARAVTARMSPQDKAGQVLVVGVPVADPRKGADAVRRYRLGGVFLHGRTTLTPAQLRARVDALRASTRSSRPPLHVAVDQEGGKVRSLQGRGFEQQPPAVEQGRQDPAVLGRAARRSAKGLHAAGVTVNFAPVADVVPAGTERANPPIGAFGRQYGSTPAGAGRAVPVVVRSSQAESVQATLKHFPGLGRVRANTDVSTRAVDARTTASDPALQPFRAGIDAGAGFVMMSSARYPALDPHQPAVFSHRIVTDLLRRSLHFDGVIVSDDLGAAKAVAAVKPGDRAVRFVAAGGDLVLTVQPADAGPMTAALTARARTDAAFRARLDDAVTHVVMSKVRAGLVPCR
ncbi:MAG: glycoside hydrolase family 3 N-terminal domain-containing protein [Kineosporiaceae bacterium]